MSGLLPDGYAEAAAGSTGGVSSGTIALTTTFANDVIVLVSFNEAQSEGTGPYGIASITDTEGLVWAQRSITSYANNNGSTLEVWWAHSPAAYSGTITPVFAHAIDDYAFLAFGVNGAATPSAPWDLSPSLPSPANSTGNSTPTLDSGFGTDAENTMLIVVGGSASFFANTDADTTDGYTLFGNPATTADGHASASSIAQYQIVSGKQSGLNCNFNTTVGGWAIIADAIAGPGSVATVRRRPFFVT